MIPKCGSLQPNAGDLVGLCLVFCTLSPPLNNLVISHIGAVYAKE
jgi:hypothetical protein